ncbi:MAG TPA: hypothetical protein VKA08_01395 [Balneolales bacterium]|nr:hypothetical protein [Balneolales bacterium]
MKTHYLKTLKLLFIVGATAFFVLAAWESLYAQSITGIPDTTRSADITSIHSNALGMSGVALAYRPSNMYANPATLSFLVHPMSLTFDHYYDASNAIQFENVSSIIVNTANQSAAVGLSFRNAGYGSLEKGLGFFPSSQSAFRFKELDLTIGYSVKVAHTLSLGALFQANNGMTTSGVSGSDQQLTGSFGLGLIYSPTPGIRYGLALRGIGRNLSYTSQNNVTQVSTVERHQELAFGITMRYPYTSLDHHPYVTLTASNEKIFREHGLWYKAGLEVLPIQELGLRVGYAYSPGFKGITVGLGLNFQAFSIDYALSPNPGSSHQFQQLAVSINLNAL